MVVLTLALQLAEENKVNMQDITKAVKKQQKNVESTLWRFKLCRLTRISYIVGLLHLFVDIGLVENCKSMQTMFETFSKQLSESLPQSLIGPFIMKRTLIHGHN